MKKLIYPFSFIIMLSLLSSECGKGKPEILYPETGDFGESILQEEDLSLLPSTEIVDHPYSMRAVLPENASLKVILDQQQSSNEGSIGTNPSSQVGWSKNSETVGYTVFNAAGPVTADVRLKFYGHGTVEISIFENGSEEPDRMKTLSW